MLIILSLLCRVILGLVCLITICSARPADEEYADYEEKAPPAKPTPRHSALLNRRAPIAKPGSLKSTTTTTTPAPVQVNINKYHICHKKPYTEHVYRVLMN